MVLVSDLTTLSRARLSLKNLGQSSQVQVEVNLNLFCPLAPFYPRAGYFSCGGGNIHI